MWRTADRAEAKQGLWSASCNRYGSINGNTEVIVKASIYPGDPDSFPEI